MNKLDFTLGVSGVCIMLACIATGGLIEQSRPKTEIYTKGYSEGYRIGKLDTLKELASKAMRDEIKRQNEEREQLKKGALPGIKGVPKFEIYKEETK